MTIETFLTKRRARYQGEVGLFPDSAMATEDVAFLPMDVALCVKAWTHKRIEQLRYLWGVVHKAQDNSNFWLDRYEAMDDLAVQVGYCRTLTDRHTGKSECKRKSLTRISDEQLRLLTDRIVDVICTEILPGIDREDLRREVEGWVNDPTELAARHRALSSSKRRSPAFTR